MPSFTPSPSGGAAPLGERDIDELQALLDRVPPPLEPLDVSMLDGFLCGVLLQPQAVLASQWLPHLTDADGRALPASFDATRLQALALRRHAELNDAIGNRQWFDPWVFEMAPEDEEETGDSGSNGDAPHETDAVYPWVAGFAAAQEFFPGLMRLDAARLTAPLALLYRHLDADDLEDADELIEEIESLEPPADLSAAVEELVRATLLLADVSRPRAAVPRPQGRVPQSRGAGRGPRSASRGPQRR